MGDENGCEAVARGFPDGLVEEQHCGGALLHLVLSDRGSAFATTTACPGPEHGRYEEAGNEEVDACRTQCRCRGPAEDVAEDEQEQRG
jgi:hypothetical protein